MEESSENIPEKQSEESSEKVPEKQSLLLYVPHTCTCDRNVFELICKCLGYLK